MNKADIEKAEIRRRILAANESAATALRDRFDAAGTLVLNLISSPGSGKTSLLEATAARLGRTLRLGAVSGDIATELDAQRLRDAGLPARQITTGGACHLEARMVGEAVEAAGFPPLDALFIENVGNLVCPTSFDLAEDFKVALLSVTEGQDKPFKYPGIFTRSAVTVVTKSDLAPHVTFDVEAVREQVRTLNPEAKFLVTSVVTGEGLDAWCELVETAVRAKQSTAAPAALAAGPAE
ncbi:MAG: hydrogenase nickel incorporation protein HypB [Planctomycetota bacterium]|jgi:hydrogenase nickel incorporation protein HypB